MPFLKTISHDKGIIGLWEITEKPEDLLAKLDQTHFTNSNYLRYTSDRRKTEWLATRIMVRELIGDNFKIEYNENNKPLISHNLYKHISISHSEKYVVVNLSTETENGIDIEKINRNFEAIKKRYLADNELIDVETDGSLPCLYWCAKEAVFKYVPDKEIEFRTQILIDKFDHLKEKTFSVSFIGTESEKKLIANFRIFDNHCLVWI